MLTLPMPPFLFSFHPLVSLPRPVWFQVNELPNNGAHIPVVQQAEALMRRMELEQKAYALLDEAMQRRDLNALVNAIAGCERMNPPLEHPKVDKAREMKVRVERCWRSRRPRPDGIEEDWQRG